MRVGMLTYGMGQELTGIGRYALQLSLVLRRLDPSIEVILINPHIDSALEWYRQFPTVAVPSLRTLPAILTIGSAVLDRIARRLGLDILHDPCGIAPFRWRRSASYARVVTIHDAIPRIHPEWYPWLDRWLFRSWLPRARWSSDAVLTVSDSSAADLTRHLGIPAPHVTVSPSGVEMPDDTTLSRLRERRPVPWSPYFLMVGRLSPRKNAWTVLRAFRELLERGEEAHFVMAGPYPSASDEAGKLARSTNNVHVLGYVNDSTLHALYASAQAVVCPSLYEGFGLPLLEGMAFGAPTISANAGSFPEVRQQAGVGVDAEDLPGWVGAMSGLLKDSALRADLAVAGRQRARDFSWERTGAITLRVYEAALRSTAPKFVGRSSGEISHHTAFHDRR